MQTEYELRILNVNKDAIIKKLKSIGAKKVHDEVLQQRYIMDFSDNRLWKKKGGWIRLRKAGDLRVELSYKERDPIHTVSSAREIYLEISDLETARQLFETIGLVVRRYQENKRLRYKKNDVVFDIDTWPGKKPYMEIESDNEKSVRDMVLALGFTEKDCCYTAGPELHKLLGFNQAEMTNLRFKENEKNN